MQSLRNLDLQGNNLRGPIPNSIGNLSYLIELQLGSNQLNGAIPAMPGRLQIALNLSHNLYEGPIPVTLSRLQNLEVLDLSNNRFSGEIPDYLTGLMSLTHLLLTNNELSGVVPSFRDHVDVETRGNNVSFPAKPRSVPTPTSTKSITSTIGLVFAITGGAIIAGVWVVLAVYISRRYYNTKFNLLSENSSNINFKKAFEAVADPSNITFKTRFSTYYKSLLPTGPTYFIKKVNRLDKMFSLHALERLGQELRVVGDLSHPNLMIPFAYLLTMRGVYLFYHFAPLGTLYDKLHSATCSALNWEERYSITIGVSQGLAFLHQCEILLLDLSSKSIVLKSSNEPQIGDIELCRLIKTSQNRGSLSTVAGSVGYVPPEYAYTMRVTEAGNVYSFGVLLLEVVTGKPAVSEGRELAKWALTISEQQSQRDEILDPNVSESETSSAVRNQMLGVVEVALACISVSPEMRPNMVNVAQMLLNIRSN